MPAFYSGTGGFYNYRFQASYGAYGSVTLTADTFTVESLRAGNNFNNDMGVPGVPLVRGIITVTDGASVITEDLGDPNDPVNGFSPFVRIGQNGSNGGIAQGSLYVTNGGTITLTNDVIENGIGQYDNAYSPLRIGQRFGGQGEVIVEGAGSAITASGGPARLDVGRDNGAGSLDIRDGGLVGAFNLTAGREGFASVSVDGQGSQLRLGFDYGNYGSAYTGSSSSSSFGRDFGGRGILVIADGGTVTAQNNDGVTDNPDIVLGRGYGSQGYAVVSGQGSEINVTQTGPLDDDVFGSSFRVGDGGRAIVLVENGGAINVTGEDAFLSVGEERDGLAATTESQLVLRSGGAVTVDSSGTASNGGVSVGRDPGARGAILVDGAGSVLLARTDNTDAGSYAGGLTIGDGGEGRLEVTNGGRVVIDGGDDLFPFFVLGSGNDGSAVTSTALVSGAGSEIEVIGTSDDASFRSPAGFISVGRRDQKTGILTIEDGGVVRSSNPNSTAEIAGNAGSIGLVTVQGAGSSFEAGEFLAIGADYVVDGFDTSIGGNGTLTLRDGGSAAAGTVYVGDSGTLNLGGTLTGDAIVTGTLNVGGAGAAEAGTVDGDLSVTNGQVVLELLDFTSGATDLLIVTGDFDIAGGQFVLDASNLARATVDQEVAILDASTLSPSFTNGDIQVTGLPSGVFFGFNRVGGNIDVSVALAPTQTVGLFGGDITITEGDGAPSVLTLTLLRSGNLGTSLDVDFAVSGGTVDALDFSGFALPSGTVSFGAGEDSTTLQIGVNADDLFEGDETFDVMLTSAATGNGSAISILNDTTTVTIIDDDPEASTILNGDVVAGDSFPTVLEVISLEPNASYLRIDPDDLTNGVGPVDAVALDLAALGFAPGDAIFLDPVGSLSPFGSTEPERADSLSAVFSATDVLLAGNELDRVQDAIQPAFGSPSYVALPSANGGLERDIPQDIAIQRTGNLLVVPDGAAFLFVAPTDIFLSDNTDADDNFGFVAFNPTVIGFSDDGDATFTSENLQDAAVIVGSNGQEGVANLVDTNWSISAELSVGQITGSGRLILEDNSRSMWWTLGSMGTRPHQTCASAPIAAMAILR